MTDQPVSDATCPMIKPPLSPELNNTSRSFRRNIKGKNKRINPRNQLNQAICEKKEDFEKVDSGEPIASANDKTVNCELNAIFKIEQERKALYDRLSMSKKVSSYSENSQHHPKNLQNINLKTSEQLEISKTSTKNLQFNQSKCLTNINNIYKIKDSSDIGSGSAHSPYYEKFVVDTQINQIVITQVTNSTINSLKDSKCVNSFASTIFKNEIFTDLKLDNKYVGFSSVLNVVNKNNETKKCDTEESSTNRENKCNVNNKIFTENNENQHEKFTEVRKTATNQLASTNVSHHQEDKDQKPEVDFEKALMSLNLKKAGTICEKNESIGNKITNIFKEENLSDINVSNKNYSCFQSASLRIQQKNAQDVHKDAIAFARGKFSNIFKDENFSDLEALDKNLKGFQKVSLKNNPECRSKGGDVDFKSLTKNIFKEENLSDLENLDKNSNEFPKASSKIKHKNLSGTTKDADLDFKSKNINIFKDENFSDVVSLTKKLQGFQKASLTIDLKKLKDTSEDAGLGFKSKNRNIFNDENFSDLENLDKNLIGFQKVALGIKHKDDIPDKSQNFSGCNTLTSDGLQTDCGNIEEPNFISSEKHISRVGGFQRVATSANQLKSVENKSFKKVDVANIFKDIDLSDILPSGASAFNSSKCLNKINYGKGLRKKAPFFKGNDHSDVSECSMSKNTLKFEESENMEWVPSYESINEFRGFTHSDQTLSVKLGIDFCHRVGESDTYLTSKYDELLRSKNKRKISGKEIDSPVLKKLKNTFDDNQSFLRKPKKRLGTHFSPSIAMSTSNLEKAKSFFREELSVCPLKTSTPILSKFGLNNHITPNITPIKFNNLTPIREESSISNTASRISTRLFFENDSTNVNVMEKLKAPKEFSLNKPTDGSVHNWLENLEVERKMLEQRLRIVSERQNILMHQDRTTLDRTSVRVKPGILYLSKAQKNRCSLKSLGEPEVSLNKFLNTINPQNAGLVHFGVSNDQASLRTRDGAEIVPNSKGQIGVSEIEYSFFAMDGVDPRLIPPGWLRNHYKWIIWKLASYERMYSEKFEGIFCVDSVVQQLKYRYDREIDKAERSALKKMFERDDCSEKRLVLCVSNIKKANKDYELELTDGWYAIRVTIDKPLSNQISKGKIKIGTKLVICGAELFNNSDGCDPLKASNDICLNISYNSTRRAVWWAKLGYQRDPSAFRVPLSAVSMEGGRIGCIRFYVARVYPIKYLMKQKEINVWKNYKAEDKRAQVFEFERSTKLEKLISNVSEQIQESECDSPVFFDNLKSVDDPEVLHKILKMSKDPEKINEMLSSSQRASLFSYQINKSSKEHSKLINKIQKKAGTLENINVTPLLRIRIVDSSGICDKDYSFYVWNPNEYHLTILKEGAIVSAFNVGCSPSWGLSARKSTKFVEELRQDVNIFKKFERKVTRIDDLNVDSEFVFQEFDTVGVVVKINIDLVQELWLSSISNSILLIQIFESPTNILLLDGISEGDVVIACNLICQEAKNGYHVAIADHYSTISKYSKFKLLQEETMALSEELATIDLNNFLKTTKAKINDVVNKSLVRLNSATSWSADDGMDCSQLTTTDIALLECVSKLEG